MAMSSAVAGLISSDHGLLENGSAVDEHIPLPVRGIGAQLVAHQRRQPVERAAQVARRRVQPDPNVPAQVQHRDECRNRRTSPPPKSSSASHTGEADGPSPSSTNAAAPDASLPAPDRPSLHLHNENVLNASASGMQNCSLVCPLCSNRSMIARHSFAERRTATRFPCLIDDLLRLKATKKTAKAPPRQ